MDSLEWYLFYDGKTAKVVNSENLSHYETIHGVIVSITSSQAAAILLLSQTHSES
jgi:hypothetical protein